MHAVHCRYNRTQTRSRSQIAQLRFSSSTSLILQSSCARAANTHQRKHAQACKPEAEGTTMTDVSVCAHTKQHHSPICAHVILFSRPGSFHSSIYQFTPSAKLFVTEIQPNSPQNFINSQKSDYRGRSKGQRDKWHESGRNEVSRHKSSYDGGLMMASCRQLDRKNKQEKMKKKKKHRTQFDRRDV